MVDFRYRIEFKEQGKDEALYELSLDHVRTERWDEHGLILKPQYHFEAELEVLGAARAQGESGLFGLFRLADKLSFYYGLTPAITTKAGIKVPPLVDNNEVEVPSFSPR